MAVSPKLKRQVLINENRMRALMNDIKNDVVRVTENAKDLDDWITKLGGYTTTNAFTTGAKADETTKIINSITKAVGTSKLPKGAHQELVKGVMSENTMHYVTKMGEDMKTELRKIAVESYDAKLAPRDIAKEMASKIEGMTNSRATVIARTETNRASVLSDYTNAKLNLGAQSFTVTSDASTVCQNCIDAYDNGSIVFDIEQNDMLPPLHPNCNCSPRFYVKSVDDMINDDASLTAY